MDKKKIQIIILLALILILAVYGIFQLTGMPPTPEKKTPTPVKSTVSIEKPKTVTVVEESFPKIYSYEFYGLRDPFYPQIVKKESVKGASVLENYEIEELKLTGIIKDIKGFRALIRTPDGKHYVVKEKDKVGPNKGQIIKISKDAIEIKETVTSYTGEASERIKTLKLKTEEGL